MFIKVRYLVGIALLLLLFVVWALLAMNGRNPLPFPDNGSRIFVASSPAAKDAVVALLAQHGIDERFEADSSGIKRSVLMDGTIINASPPEVIKALDGAGSAIGLVSDDPVKSANEAAAYLRARGFKARVVTDIEPNLPIAFSHRCAGRIGDQFPQTCNANAVA